MSTMKTRVRPMLTPAQVAERLGVSERLVYGLLQRGEMESHRIGTRWRISHEALSAYLGSTVHVPDQQYTPTPKAPVVDGPRVDAHRPRW